MFKKAAILLIIIYQRCISAFTMPCCRFHPTCSEYSIIAIKRFGVFKGIFLSVKRILRCNPWGGYGEDPVPEKFSFMKNNISSKFNMNKYRFYINKLLLNKNTLKK